MKKFNFRLASILRIKEFEEKNAWNEVLKQEGRVLNLKNQMDNLRKIIAQNAFNASQAGSERAFNHAEISLGEEAYGALTAKIQVLEGEYRTELKVLEKLVLRHRESKKDAKVLQNFQERKKQEYRDEANKKEQKQTNEHANQVHYRRMKNNG